MRKRIVSLLLSLALCLTLLPTAAFAEKAQPEEPLPKEQLEQVQPVSEEPGENEEQSQQDEDVIAVQALIDQGYSANFVTFTAGTTLPEGMSGSEHLTSFDYAYRLETVRDWLFAQST